jgi:hypothetical protein
MSFLARIQPAAQALYIGNMTQGDDGFSFRGFVTGVCGSIAPGSLFNGYTVHDLYYDYGFTLKSSLQIYNVPVDPGRYFLGAIIVGGITTTAVNADFYGWDSNFGGRSQWQWNGNPWGLTGSGVKTVRIITL